MHYFVSKLSQSLTTLGNQLMISSKINFKLTTDTHTDRTKWKKCSAVLGWHSEQNVCRDWIWESRVRQVSDVQHTTADPQFSTFSRCCSAVCSHYKLALLMLCCCCRQLKRRRSLLPHCCVLTMLTTAGHIQPVNIITWQTPAASRHPVSSSLTVHSINQVLHLNRQYIKTRQLSYRKEDRAMRPIYGCPENFWKSSLRTRLLFQKFVTDFCSDRY